MQVAPSEAETAEVAEAAEAAEADAEEEFRRTVSFDSVLLFASAWTHRVDGCVKGRVVHHRRPCWNRAHQRRRRGRQ